MSIEDDLGIDPDPRLPFILTDELRQAILDLAKQSDIRSVACAFDDFDLWDGLIKEQIKRSQETGLPLAEAFYLCGPDGGIKGQGAELSDDGEEWVHDQHFLGGDVHIPYEGITNGDLFVLPEWHRTCTRRCRETGEFWRIATYKPYKLYNYLLTNRDLGEFECAERTLVAGCYLYKNKTPYIDCRDWRKSLDALKK